MSGQRDTPLTDIGRAQALEAAETLADYKFDHVYTSDLIRALEQTRAVLARQKFPVSHTLVPELRERSGGSVEGIKYTALKKRMSPRKYKLWQRDFFEAPPDGESLHDVALRVLPWFDDNVIPRISKNENILIVAHAGVIRVLISYVKKIDETEIMGWDIEHSMPYFFYGRG